MKLNNLQFFAWTDVTNEGGNSDKRKVEFAKLNSGDTIRILDAEPFSRWAHWIASIKRSITCLGKQCPVCNIIKDQKANGETPKYASSKRHAIAIWNYATNRVEMLEGGNEVFQQLANLQTAIAPLVEYDLKVIKSGSGKDTKYQFIPQVAKAVTEDILKEYKSFKEEVNIAEFYKAFTYDQVIMILEGKTLEEVFEASNQEKDSEVPFEEGKEEVSFELEE